MAKKSDKNKTNAARQLDTQGIKYRIFSADDPEEFLSGVEMAEKIGVAPGVVFKTLVTKGPGAVNYVCVIPSDKELDLKKAAKHFSEKKIEMLPSKDILAVTGYIKGGCSPIGMKKLFATAIDDSALSFGEIYVSAGRRGMQLLVAPADLASVINAKFAPLT
ncbi:MAG: Cys-tRNA(Pro) deacylase [Clostridiales Family XIII bacterium]|jgi:Cys-tRNA(Pro)/Cys-tRNA(Cys) deacylase|nr:Cys-tRNA(Pro) deacylase [Clostridiales Family XIII bacterium]